MSFTMAAPAGLTAKQIWAEIQRLQRESMKFGMDSESAMMAAIAKYEKSAITDSVACPCCGRGSVQATYQRMNRPEAPTLPKRVRKPRNSAYQKTYVRRYDRTPQRAVA